MNNRVTFRQHLEIAYTDLLENNPDYAYVATKTTPADLAEKMTENLANKTASLEGDGIKRVCKILGIKRTQKAIKEYLTAD